MMHRPAPDEHGMASVMALLVVVLLAAGGVVVAMNAAGSSANTQERQQSVAGRSGLDGAIAQYQAALEAGLASEGTGYLLLQGDMRRLPAQGGTPLGTVPNQSLAQYGIGLERVVRNVAPQLRGPSQFAAVEGVPGSGSLQRYWQIYRVIPPTIDRPAGSPFEVVVYFRSWIGRENGSMSRPEYARVSFRPTYFTDYQLLVNGPAVFGRGARITGRVHSNGYSDGTYTAVPPALQGTGTTIYWDRDGNVPRCSGPDAMLTTTFGAIDNQLEGPGRCPADERSVTKPISLGRVVDSYREMEVACGVTVECPGNGNYYGNIHVALSGNQVSWWAVDEDGQRSGGPSGSSSLAAGSLGILVMGDAFVSGGVNGRFTVAARYPDFDRGAADIVITDSVGRTGSALGLIAQGNIRLRQRAADPCRIRNIRAGMVSETGSVTLDPIYTTLTYQSGAPSCNRTEPLVLDGSIAAMRSPILRWNWGDTEWTGFRRREYSWDDALKTNPPPFFPRSGAWRVGSYGAANNDCLDPDLAEATPCE